MHWPILLTDNTPTCRAACRTAIKQQVWLNNALCVVFYQTSGVKVADEVKDLYNEMKLVKNEDDENERLRVAIFEIENGFIKIANAIRQKDLSNVEDVFKHTMNLLDNKVCRYMLYDCHYETKEAIKKEELVFMMW